MKRQIMIIGVLLAMLGTLLTPKTAKAANAVVGTGSAASCTEAAFDTALTTVNTTGGGTITFNCGASEVTITLTTQKLINLSNVTINGNNRIVLDGSLGVRHFFVGNGVTFTLQNIKLRHGDPLLSGGAIEINESTVNLESVELSNNYASTIGGAIYCFGLSGVVNISNSSLINNSAGTSGGAIYNDGCQMVITNSTFLHNTTASNGGGIYNVQPG
ncbi:MAG TPA: hypothetical protein PK414_13095, partial [Anaerolineales bacterium]|nr:hypothetical protein [Anaerolineales bacterium]